MKTPHFWQSKNLLSTALLPASYLYGFGAWLDRARTTPQRASLPVISIGNLTAGGAGKTPTTLALIPLLQALGHTPHILTRGYGGANLSAHRVQAGDDWRSVGDEALLLAAAAPTWVGHDRLASAKAAKNAGATILVCDDALQHHALHKDISILVVDGPYGFGNGRLLPAGPLREPVASARARVQGVVLIGEADDALRARLPQPVFDAVLTPTAGIVQGQKYLAFAGIGRPEKFYETLRTLGATLVETCNLPDHYAYPRTMVEALVARAAMLGATPITTEKDAVKIPPDLRAAITTLPVTLRFADEAAFRQWLAQNVPPA